MFRFLLPICIQIFHQLRYSQLFKTNNRFTPSAWKNMRSRSKPCKWRKLARGARLELDEEYHGHKLYQITSIGVQFRICRRWTWQQTLQKSTNLFLTDNLSMMNPLHTSLNWLGGDSAESSVNRIPNLDNERDAIIITLDSVKMKPPYAFSDFSCSAY